MLADTISLARTEGQEDVSIWKCLILLQPALGVPIMWILEVGWIKMITYENWIYESIYIHIDSFHFKGFGYLSEKNRISWTVIPERLFEAGCEIFHLLEVVLVVIGV